MGGLDEGCDEGVMGGGSRICMNLLEGLQDTAAADLAVVVDTVAVPLVSMQLLLRRVALVREQGAVV